MKKYFAISLIAALFIAGCYYDKKDDIYPAGSIFTPCDTTSHPSYSRNIAPLMQNYCFSCHSGSQPSSNYRLDNYTDLNVQVQNGNLNGCVNRLHAFNPMPPSFTLDSCRMNMFNHWIADGAPNN
ncbi:MAG: hypothetical protein HY064_13005 [Bacteroidetes bacterium]|nr:hypothetical protein [Bacteroidota bacterium]